MTMQTVSTEVAAARLESLGSPPRLTLVRELVKAGNTGLSVGELKDRLAMPGSTLSHHLHHLIEAELVSQEREGRVLRCRANFATMAALVDFLLAECCRDDTCC